MPKFTGFLCDETGKQIIPGTAEHSGTAYCVQTMEYFDGKGERVSVQRRYVHSDAFETLKAGEKVNTRNRTASANGDSADDADAKATAKATAKA